MEGWYVCAGGGGLLPYGLLFQLVWPPPPVGGGGLLAYGLVLLLLLLLVKGRAGGACLDHWFLMFLMSAVVGARCVRRGEGEEERAAAMRG